MALDPTVLTQLIISKVESKLGASPLPAGAKVYAAIAEAVIEHLTTAGEVTVAVTSVSGVTTGTGTSGPGTGTGTIA